MNRANYFPLGLITAAVLLSVAATFWLTDREQNQRRRLVLRNQSANTIDQFTRVMHDRAQELRGWGAAYVRSIEAARPDGASATARTGESSDNLAQAFSPADHYDLILVVDADRRIRSATADPARAGAVQPWLLKRYTEVLPGRQAADEDWLAPVFASGTPVALGWAPQAAVNRLYGREAADTSPVNMHQIVLAVRPGDGPAARRHVVVGVLRWRYFQEILDGSYKLLTDADLPSGYAYLIDADGDTVIGHKNQTLLASRLKTLAEANPGLDPFRRAVQATLTSGKSDFQPYQFPGTTSKTAFLYLFGADPADEIPLQLRWVLGVGADDADLRRAVRNNIAWFFLPSAMVALAAGRVYLLWARRYRATFREVVDTIKRAKTLDEVASSCSTERRYNELIQAAGELIVRSREGRLFTSIPNTYVVGRPISDGQMFFGRGRELETIGLRLREPGNELLILAGQRRIGKTSLLYQIGRQANGYTCVFVDTQRIAPSVGSDADLYAKLHEAIARAVGRPPTAGGAPLQHLNELMRDLHERHTRIVLLIDEFENLEELLAKNMMTQGPLLWLAAQLDGPDPFSMVVTGSEGMSAMSPTWQRLGPKAQRWRVSFLSVADAEALVQQPLLGFASFAENTVESILRVTGCHPLMTQDFCYRLVSRLNAERVTEVTLRDVDLVSQDLVENAPPWIEYAWSRLDEGERLALRLLVRRLPDAAGYADPVDAVGALPAEIRGHSFAGGVPQNEINVLLDQEWLQKSGGGYRFRCDLHRRWINEYHPLDLEQVS